MLISFRTCFFILILFAAKTSPIAAADKHPATPSQMIIDSLKSLGVNYQGDLWHQVEAELISRRAVTAALLTAPGSSRDGGNGSANATVVSSNGYVDNGTTLGKGNNASIPSCLSGGSDTAPDAWYILTVSEPVNLTVWTTCASGFPSTYDTRLGMFSSALALLACNDDDAGCSPNVQSRIEDQALNCRDVLCCRRRL